MPKNAEAICRVCLRKGKSRFISLQECVPLDRDQQLVSYAEAYTNCTQLEVQVGLDGLPEWLCNSCSRDLQCAYDFRNKARESFEKLSCQLEMEKEYEERAVTPSEFALPDNNEVVAYVHADADLMDACSMKGTTCARDPLEDFESDNEAIGTLSKGKQSPMYDSDDDKPLKQLTNKNDFNRTEEMDLVENIPNFVELTLRSFPFEDDDEFIVDKDSTNDKITDPMFSPEVQIFPKGRFKCCICEHRYFTKIGLNAHMELHEVKKKTSHIIHCRKSVKSRPETEEVNSDTSNQHVTKDIEKSACDENEEITEIQVPQNESKTRKKKEPKTKRMLPCKVCGKHFISASKLRYHMVMHTGERNYLCTMCPNSYTTIYGLRHHIRSHTGERPYECKFCGDRFLRTTTLKSHQRRHTGERPYGCDICGKRFIQHSSMATHMRLNHMDKTIQCPHCIKKYARQTDLNAHLLSHTGYKPFRCQLCPSRFVRQSNLNKHMNQQHAKVPNVSAMVDNNSNAAGSGDGFIDNCFDFNSTENINVMPNKEPAHILKNEDFKDFVIDHLGIDETFHT